jgi:hypothetical protein
MVTLAMNHRLACASDSVSSAARFHEAEAIWPLVSFKWFFAATLCLGAMLLFA